MSADFRPGDRVRFTQAATKSIPWLFRGIVRLLNRYHVWRVVMVIDGDSQAGQLAVQHDSDSFDGPISELPISMFEHVRPGLRARLQRIGGRR